MRRAFIGCLYDTYIFYKIMDNTRNLFCTNEVIKNGKPSETLFDYYSK